MNKPTSNAGPLTSELADGLHTIRYRPPYYGFAVTLRDEVIGRYEGIGLTLDEVLRRLVEGWAPSNQGDPFDEDLCVWEDKRCVAVLRADAAGKPIVTRFDDPEAGPVTSSPEVRPGSDDEQEEKDQQEDDPDPDDEDEPEGDDEEADEPDALAQRRALLRTRSPLFRGTIAFADPGTPDFLVQLEIIITSENVEDSPGFYDLPESRQAGWISHSHGTMNIAVRTIS